MLNPQPVFAGRSRSALAAVGLFIGIGLTHIAAADEAQPKTPVHKASQKWALLIGVNDYAYVKKLRFCVNDQTAIHDRLIEQGYLKDHVYLMTDDAKDTKYRTTKTNIEQQIKGLAQLVEEDDVLLVAFSGHGVNLKNVSYICPIDAKLAAAAETMIPVDWLYQQLDQMSCKAALKILLIDACRNEIAVEETRSVEDTAADSRRFAEAVEKVPTGTVLLSSCGPNEFAREAGSLNQGVFTYFLLRGLAGEADENGDGIVTLGELAKYTSKNTKKFVFDKFVDKQNPRLKGDVAPEALDFDISRVKKENALASSTVRPDVPKIITPEPPKPVEPLVAPFDAKTAAAARTAWAKKLGQEETTTNSIGMKLTLIPAGEFMMGNEVSVDEVLKVFPYADRRWVEFSAKQHRVRITKPFYLGVYTVTLGQFLSFYHDAGYKCEAETNGKGGKGWTGEIGGAQLQNPKFVPWSWGFAGQSMNHPVVNVSWNDAAAFCVWLSKKDGKKYRLPTEAEWEYACRAGTTTRYSFGNDPEGLVKYANSWDAGVIEKWPAALNRLKGNDGYIFTAPVGSFLPNPFGLYDMHGNVNQWCADWFGKDYYSVSGVDDPQGPATGTQHILRGGSWVYHAAACRCAARGHLDTADITCELGFRIVLER